MSLSVIKSEHRTQGRRFMSLWAEILAFVTCLVGLVSRPLKRFQLRHEIRRAIQVELKRVVVTLNFYIREALGNPGSVHKRFNPGDARLQSFEFYWNNHRERLLALPEWSLLKDWNENLGMLAIGVKDPLFHAISLFERLRESPLNRCVDGSTRTVIQHTLRDGADAYFTNSLIKQAGIRQG